MRGHLLSRDGITSRFVFLGAAHVIGVTFSFLATLIVVHAHGPAGFGSVALGLAVLNYAVVATNFGTDLYAVQATARDPEQLGVNLGAVALIRTALSLLAIAGILVLCVFSPWDGETQLTVALFGLSIFANAWYPLWAPQALERTRSVALCNGAAQALNLLFVGAVALMGMEIWAYAVARIAADAILAVCLTVWTARLAGGLNLRFSLRHLTQLLHNAAPLGVSQILRGLALGSDILILGFVLTPVALGQYAAAFRIFTLLLSIGSLYFVVVLPIFSRRAREGRDALTLELSESMRRSLPVTLAGAIALAAAASPILVYVFGQDFAAGAPSLQLLMIALAANYLHRSYRQVLLAAGHRISDMRSTLGATLVNFVVKALSIPIFGMHGAAIGTAAGEVLLLFLQRRAARRAIRSLPERS